MAKEVQYPHVPGHRVLGRDVQNCIREAAGGIPPTVTGPASLKKWAGLSEFRNKVAVLADEEINQAATLQVLVARAHNAGREEIAKKLADIANDELRHKRELVEIANDLWRQQ